MNDQQKIYWKHYMHDQEIEIQKYIEKENKKIKYNTKNKSAFKWIKKYASKFRKRWLKTHPNELF